MEKKIAPFGGDITVPNNDTLTSLLTYNFLFGPSSFLDSVAIYIPDAPNYALMVWYLKVNGSILPDYYARSCQEFSKQSTVNVGLDVKGKFVELLVSLSALAPANAENIRGVFNATVKEI